MEIKELTEKYGVHDTVSLKKALNKIKNKEVFLFTMSGKMASGKDTVGDIISKKLHIKNGQEIINVSFEYLIRKEIDYIVKEYKKSVLKADYAKLVHSTQEDLDKLLFLIKEYSAFDRTDEARLALQFWDTEVRRKFHKDYWINKMSAYIVDTVNLGYSINITDSKFPNEVKLVENMSGKIIRLKAPENVRKQRIKYRDNIDVSKETLNNESELALDNYEFDKVFDGTELPEILGDIVYEYITK